MYFEDFLVIRQISPLLRGLLQFDFSHGVQFFVKGVLAGLTVGVLRFSATKSDKNQCKNSWKGGKRFKKGTFYSSFFDTPQSSIRDITSPVAFHQRTRFVS